MTTCCAQHNPQLDGNIIKAGTDVRVSVGVYKKDQTGACLERDYTGATGTATICPTKGDSFSVPIVLLSDPAADPQIYFDITPTDTDTLEAPQRCQVYMVITLATGNIDKGTCWFDLWPGGCS